MPTRLAAGPLSLIGVAGSAEATLPAATGRSRAAGISPVASDGELSQGLERVVLSIPHRRENLDPIGANDVRDVDQQLYFVPLDHTAGEDAPF